MPEGDTVWLAGRRLHDALAGHRLTGTDFRVPQLATTDLTGRLVCEVVSRGKHLLTRIDDDLTLHTHFRMDGTWPSTGREPDGAAVRTGRCVSCSRPTSGGPSATGCRSSN